MPSITAYHRPDSLAQAASLLADPRRRVLAGGTVIVPLSRQITDHGVELVDLQALDLTECAEADMRLRIGAMFRLGELAEHELAPPLLHDAARRELPSALRNQATIGGTIAAKDPDSVLLAALLVHDAQVDLHGSETTPLDDLLSQGVAERIITAVSIDPSATGSIAVTGRTPADVPIVSAVARSTETGVQLALTGVADRPVLADPSDVVAGLAPPSDFRGSSDYRLHLAQVLSRRAIAEVTS